ncbi:hypothetical protein [Prosthecobacter sp.]|uniref:hypothetical protein n=1 Tax=Prosthecobacter sp. TaxID=1965333 RepID=UPI003783DF9E
MLTTLILMMLGWNAAGGQHIPPGRWLCGLLSGWFIVFMFRTGLFIWLAAPRFICCDCGQLQVSGLGRLRTSQILHWTIEHQVMIHARNPRGARLRICCRWLGWKRHWMMLMEEGPRTERLQRELELLLPRTVTTNPKPTQSPLPMEAGILSP